MAARRLHLTTGLGLVAGLGLLAVVAADQDLEAVAAAVTAAGWGVMAVALWRAVPLAFDAAGWARLVAMDERPGFFGLLRARWIGESVNTLLPVAQVGGDVVRARLLARLGVPGARAGASVAADFTVGLAVQLVFTLAGLGLLAGLVGDGAGLVEATAGLAAAAAVVGVLWGVQRHGLFQVFEKLAHRADWQGLAAGVRDLDAEVRAVYRRHGALAGCAAWRLGGWVVRSGETWLALRFMGVPVGLAEALVIEALSNAARSAAFAVPGAVGAQDGGVVGTAVLLGLSPEVGLALALVKRLREVLVSVPGVAAWWWIERRPRRPKTSAAGTGPLRVAVLVDLEWTPIAGGHVKCWERLAEAAARRDDLDLTVHFSGFTDAEHVQAPNVRFVTHRPVFSTRRLPFLSHIPDHTDLAPWHPRLARRLVTADVIHTTDGFFAFARTAARVAASQRIPLTNSIHTDTPGYTRVFTARTVERLVGHGRVGRWLLEDLEVHERAARDMATKLARHQAGAAFALVSRDDERAAALRVLPPERIGFLRRGIDRAFFSPAKRDRAWLERTYGVAAGRVVILFVGRVNRGKNVMVLAEAVRAVIDRGLPAHLFCAGDGEDRPAVAALLDGHATCAGTIDRDALARVYASADLFALPSEIEVFGNVVMEALASGRPVLVAEKGGMGRIVIDGETGHVVGGTGPEPWADALAAVVEDAGRRAAMGTAARLHAEKVLPSWDDVLAEDLMSVWRRVAGAAGPSRSRTGC